MELTSAFNGVVKIGSIAVLIVYLLFAGVVVRQINLMVKTFNTSYESQIKLLGWIHLGVTILVLFVAVIL